MHTEELERVESFRTVARQAQYRYQRAKDVSDKELANLYLDLSFSLVKLAGVLERRERLRSYEAGEADPPPPPEVKPDKLPRIKEILERARDTGRARGEIVDAEYQEVA